MGGGGCIEGFGEKYSLVLEPLLDWYMPVFAGKCFPGTSKKNKVAGTKYQLNLSVLFPKYGKE